MLFKLALLLPPLLAVLVSEADGRAFITSTTYPSGEFPNAAVVQDFNGDQISDIASANLNDANVSVFLGRADGTFGPANNFSVAAGANDVASADLDHDGDADLVVTDENDSVHFLPGNGDGTFATSTRIRLHTNPIGIEIADLNQDGNLDLAIAVFGPPNNSGGEAAVLLGNGNGTFATPVYYRLTHNGNRLIATDLNADGKLDLAVAVQHFNEEKDGLAILLGQGDGTFLPVATSVPGDASDLTAGDFNGDGKIDIALAALFDDSVRVVLGNGDGTFQPAAVYSTEGSAVTVTSADLNRDGKLDLVVGGDHVVTLPGNGDGSFGAPSVYAIGNRFATVGNVNRDRALDVVAGGGFSAIGVAFGKGNGTFRAPLAFPVGDRVDGFDAADFDGDGSLDLAVGSLQTVSNGFSILLGNGHGGFVEGARFGNAAPEFVRTGDFNGDANQDFLYTLYSGGGVFIHLGNGDGTFQPVQTTPLPDVGTWPAVADLNHDGLPDAVIARFVGDRITILLSSGDGTFQNAGDLAAGDGSQAPLISDFNSDGNPDVAVSNTLGDTVGIYLGNGDGTFQSPLTTTSPNPIYSAAGDFNHDGKPDLILAGDGLKFFLGNGDGTFQPPQILYLEYGPIAVRDIDGDGKLDVAVSADFAEMIVLRGQGDGTFRAPVSFATGSQFTADLLLEDLTGDGLPEAIVSNSSTSISVLLNNNPRRP